MKFKHVITLLFKLILIFSFTSVSYASGAGLGYIKSNNGGPGGNSGDGGVSVGGRVMPPWANNGRSNNLDTILLPDAGGVSVGGRELPDTGGVSVGGLIWKMNSRVRCEARAVMLAEKIGNINVQRFANEILQQLTVVSSAYYHSNNHKENALLTDYISNESFLSEFRARVNSELPDLYQYRTITDCNDKTLISNVRLTTVQKQNITEALNNLIRNIKP